MLDHAWTMLHVNVLENSMINVMQSYDGHYPQPKADLHQCTAAEEGMACTLTRQLCRAMMGTNHSQMQTCMNVLPQKRAWPVH
jgi:hypothetical protein